MTAQIACINEIFSLGLNIGVIFDNRLSRKQIVIRKHWLSFDHTVPTTGYYAQMDHLKGKFFTSFWFTDQYTAFLFKMFWGGIDTRSFNLGD